MGYRSLQECVTDLERTGQLVRIEQEIDPYLEAAAVHRRVYQAGGPALLYNRVKGCKFRAAPVVEFVGWTVLSGQEADGATGTIENARGDTIINAKLGVRFGFGELIQPGGVSRTDFYVGYGRALTGDVWYRDLIRAEWRINF